MIYNAPTSVDTLNELAAALAGDATFATTIQNAVQNRADKSTTYTKRGKLFSKCKRIVKSPHARRPR